MMSIKSLITFLLFLLLLMPGKECTAQKVESENTDNELLQADETGAKEKKKKDKNIIVMDDRFFFGLGIDIVAVILIITLIYYPNYHKMDSIFTFIMFNLVIFMITFVLKYVKLSVGAAFGLFAVFSMLRYRTAGVSIRDMTYLFIFIAMGLLSAIQLEPYKLAVIVGIIFTGTFILDSRYFMRRELSKDIQYEKIELVGPDKKEELLADLKKRTGLNIHRFTIDRINFLRDTARIRVYYYDKK